MLKNIFAAIGVLTVAMVFIALLTFGGRLSEIASLDDKALPAYIDMFDKVLKSGDPAFAMMKEWEVAEGISGDEVKESIEALAEEYNMRVTNYVKMYTKEDAKPNEVMEARIWSLCNLTTAKVFLNYSRWYGGFMPCRIMYVKYGNGKAYLVSMDMTLAIFGGQTLPKEMLEAALKVKDAMEGIPERAAAGDF